MQVQLNIQTQQLAARLEYFTFLEQAQRMLNYPGDNLVLSEGFLSMVERLDGCLRYLREHVSHFCLSLCSVLTILDPQQDFKDADIYLIRYQQCMTRSMTLIKMYFVNAVRQLGAEVYKKIYDRVSLRRQLLFRLLIFRNLVRTFGNRRDGVDLYQIHLFRLSPAAASI